MGNDGAVIETRVGLYWKWRNACARFRKWLLSYNQWGDDGPGGPPNDGVRLTILVDETHEYGRVQTHSVFASFLNDAFEIWIGETYTDGDVESGGWKFSCRTEVFRRLALWYLWRWAWGEWFGLRRKLFYWDLRRRCRKWSGDASPR